MVARWAHNPETKFESYARNQPERACVHIETGG